MYFENQNEFNDFLKKNHQSQEGIWIKLDKRNRPSKLTSDQALK